jgi:hypothetical protein
VSRSEQIRKALSATVGRVARQAEKRVAATQRRRQNPQLVALARLMTPPDVKVTFHKGNFGRALWGERKIYAPYLTTVVHLQLYLHELGHLWHPNRYNSEGEYLAEAYSLKMLRPTGIPLPRKRRREGIAYVGWYVVDDVLHDRGVSDEALAFVGLKGVHPIAIARAHIMAVERIGYVPKHQRHGKLMTPPVDTNYWSAVLAAVPKVKRRRPGFALIRIDRSKPLGLDNVAWSRWPEAGPQVHPVPTEAERKEWMAAIEQEERMRRAIIIEAMKQALIDRDELDPMTEAMIDAGEWDDVDGYDD